MNKIIYIVLIALFFCTSVVNAQEKLKVEKPKFGGSDDTYQRIAPGMIHFAGILKGISKDQSICNTSYDTTASIKVKDIIGSGSSITNMVLLGQEITMGFIKTQVKNIDDLQKQISNKQEFIFVIRESLCLGNSKTSYEIMSFTPKN